MTDLSIALTVARKAAAAGAKVVSKRYGETSNARVKGEEKGLITDTDLEAENAILTILNSESTYGILSEESGYSGKSSGPKWVVDPIDGTSNFARALPFFAVSVALVDGNNFLVGVIVDVTQKKEFYAKKDGGAFLNDKKIVIPKFNKNFSPSLFLNHGYSETDRNRFKELAKKVALDFDTLKLGTTALELCYISEGLVDGFVCSGDELWDFAAGAVIATEAGYIFSDWKGNPWESPGKQLLFARPEIHKDLVEIIKDIQ